MAWGDSCALQKLSNGNHKRTGKDGKRILPWFLRGSGHVLKHSGDPCLGTEVQTLLKVIKSSRLFSSRLYLTQQTQSNSKG